MAHIFLYGPMGSGKTTVGRILAKDLNLAFLDIDTEIELQSAKTILEIISEYGEAYFRDIESEMISQQCMKATESGMVKTAVIALGGGALLRESNRNTCEASGVIVFLDANLEILLQRLGKDDPTRPLISGDIENKLTKLLEKRKDHYDSFELRIATYNKNNSPYSKKPEAISLDIQKVLGRYRIKGMGNGYDVIVENGGLNKLGSYLKEHGLCAPFVLVCDENIHSLYAKQILVDLKNSDIPIDLIVIKPGEEHKTIDTVLSLWRGFLSSGLDRKGTVIALGGGVVSDLCGFAAATFMRGCQWVVLPTTLLSMVDASMGGKTGFDLAEGKNLVGAFYPPRFVLADPEVLSTLPAEEFLSGLAEVVKHAIIADPDLFDICSQGIDMVRQNISAIVRQAMSVKVIIIQQDPFETGIRASLNLGHTVGHAIEIASNYRLRHGEAIAIGTVIEARLSEKLNLATVGFAQEIETVFQSLGLPTEIPTDLDKNVIISAMKLDKKKEKNVVKFALPISIGNVQVNIAIQNLEMVL